MRYGEVELFPTFAGMKRVTINVVGHIDLVFFFLDHFHGNVKPLLRGEKTISLSTTSVIGFSHYLSLLLYLAAL